MAGSPFHQSLRRDPVAENVAGYGGLEQKIYVEKLRRYLIKHLPDLFGGEPDDWAWRWSYWGRAASAIYCRTNDPELLHQTVSVQRMIAAKGEKAAPVHNLEIAALIALPFTDLLLRAPPGTLPADIRDAMLQTVVDLIEPHLITMKDDPASGAGYFVKPGDGSIQPQNHANLYAAAAVEVFILTNDTRFSLVGEKVYRFFKNSWWKEENETVSWAYSPRPGHSNMAHPPMRYGKNLNHFVGAEFFSKAAVSVELPAAMHRANLAPAGDLELIARSINGNVFQPDCDLNFYISPRKIHLCSDELVGPKPLIRFHYLCGFSLLSGFSPALAGNIETVVNRRTDLYPAGWYSGAAGLMAHARHLIE